MYFYSVLITRQGDEIYCSLPDKSKYDPKSNDIIENIGTIIHQKGNYYLYSDFHNPNCHKLWRVILNFNQQKINVFPQ